MEQVRMGIIGIGSMGTVHALSIMKGNIQGMVLLSLIHI